jgi:hypothetical protein
VENVQVGISEGMSCVVSMVSPQSLLLARARLDDGEERRALRGDSGAP